MARVSGMARIEDSGGRIHQLALQCAGDFGLTLLRCCTLFDLEIDAATAAAFSMLLRALCLVSLQHIRTTKA